jgi:hypothetical protein
MTRHGNHEQGDNGQMREQDETTEDNANDSVSSPVSLRIVASKTQTKNAEDQGYRPEDKPGTGNECEDATVISSQRLAVLVWDKYGNRLVLFLVAFAPAPPWAFLALVVIARPAGAKAISFVQGRRAAPRTLFLKGFIGWSRHGKLL